MAMNRKAGDRWFGLVCTGFFLSATVQISPGAVDFLFSNTNFMTINDSASPLTMATPYPSANLVTGLAGRVVTRVTVTLHGLSHTFPSDVSILLVGPEGQMAILMSEVGGQEKYSVTNLTLTLDDDATNSLPVYTSLTSGQFKPTNGYLLLGYPGLPYDFPLPAPPGNSNSVSVLSVFNNTDPDGTWNLFVVCDSAGSDLGSLSNGWDLNLTVAVPLEIVRSDTNVIISWPALVTNGQLQSSPILSGSNTWSNVVITPVPVAGRLTVTSPISGENTFYRLVTN
jgi:subtilisin-like proprotein convertase family protein